LFKKPPVVFRSFPLIPNIRLVLGWSKLTRWKTQNTIY